MKLRRSHHDASGRGASHRVELPDARDVVVSDLRGMFPVVSDAMSAIIDARERFLAPGGALIPHEDRLFVSLVSVPELYANLTATPAVGDFSMAASRRAILNSIHRLPDAGYTVLADAARWATLDYATFRVEPLSADVVVTAHENGAAHGLVVWFDATIAPGLEFSNAPGPAPLPYGRCGVLPFEAPIDVRAGDSIAASACRAFLAAGRVLVVVGFGDGYTRGAEIVGRASQSTAQSMPFSRAQLEKSSMTFVPRLAPNGLADRAVLDAIDGQRSTGAIVDALASESPSLFRGSNDLRAPRGVRVVQRASTPSTRADVANMERRSKEPLDRATALSSIAAPKGLRSCGDSS